MELLCGKKTKELAKNAIRLLFAYKTQGVLTINRQQVGVLQTLSLISHSLV